MCRLVFRPRRLRLLGFPRVSRSSSLDRLFARSRVCRTFGFGIRESPWPLYLLEFERRVADFFVFTFAFRSATKLRLSVEPRPFLSLPTSERSSTKGLSTLEPKLEGRFVSQPQTCISFRRVEKPNFSLTSALFFSRHQQHKPSALVDLETGRPIEIEVTIGSILRMGRRVGRTDEQMTILRLVYGLMKVVQKVQVDGYAD